MKPEHAQFDQNTVVEVEIDSLSTTYSPRSRGTDPEHVEALVAAETTLPPIIVHRATMRVIDGLHRLRAAERRGQKTIAVRFFDGTESDAFVLAVESNIAHGLPLTMTDRKHAAGRIVTSHPHWSDRMIASVTGLAPGTIAELRRKSSGGPNTQPSRLGKDGRVRPLNSDEGRRLASELIAQDPGLSLRQIARAAAISPETARDVRNRMSRGEDPLRISSRRRSTEQASASTPIAPGTTTASPASPATSAILAATDRTPVQNRTAAVERLKADPALRFSETGRALLRLLNIHAMSTEEWQEIIDNVPSHCGGIVADLASECAGMWAELVLRVERRMAETHSSPPARPSVEAGQLDTVPTRRATRQGRHGGPLEHRYSEPEIRA
ncbi:ParB/RepB/Spo0J family partition protein [Streptomyces sp. HUAS TT20]|uniref:ParB/RepB/Spo0J family partition protein n=1 Tax=Streptomyces sp. HUAS TT20 TaxID=3447509 RepID=UPI0021D8AE31|nr:ParB/RepB/Spo0J family partition protein [Streptomyces sp. HUAS 15-9]UXY31768.1 ParB/RepB/Spo0J family partition protein [Streptomyces sp. HUAS 15-9]